jgi:hypothetical protein
VVRSICRQGTALSLSSAGDKVAHLIATLMRFSENGASQTLTISWCHLATLLLLPSSELIGQPSAGGMAGDLTCKAPDAIPVGM